MFRIDPEAIGHYDVLKLIEKSVEVRLAFDYWRRSNTITFERALCIAIVLLVDRAREQDARISQLLATTPTKSPA